MALRRRKYQESILAKTDSQLENLEQLVRTIFRPHCLELTATRCVQVSTIEFSLVQVAVMEGLKQGNDVLKEIHRELNIENVERLLDETREAQAQQRVRVCATAHDVPWLMHAVCRRSTRLS